MLHHRTATARSFIDPRVEAYDRLSRTSQQMQKAWLAFTSARGSLQRAQTAVDKLEGRRPARRARA